MRGTADLEKLCRTVRKRGMDTVALTDTNGVYGLIFFLQIARETGIRPIVGAEVVTDEARAVLLVKSREGYANLCRILTRRHCEDHFVLSQSLRDLGSDLVVLSDTIPLLLDLKGRTDVYVELMGGKPNRSLLEFSRHEGMLPVATNGVYFLEPQEHRLHCLLRAIDLNTKMSRLPLGETAPPSAWLLSPEEMEKRFPHVPQSLENAVAIAEQCRFNGDFESVISPKFDNLDPWGIMDMLRRKCREGACRRYGKVTSEVQKRLEYELGIIEAKGFGSVFLVVDDIVHQAPRTCGRGSAAASLVSYCLGITHVDPLKYNLYFERFLNPGRKDPPDIDVDFPWDERDDVLNYVFEKYGTGRSAMVANHVGFRPRAAVREIAKVYGLPEGEIKRITDRLAHLWYWSGESVEEMMREHPIFQGLNLEPPWPEILAWSSHLQGMVRHLSVHCGGVVVVPDELSRYVPAEEAPKGVRIVQWEKDQTEDSGLVKIDLLGNRSLAVIRDTLEAVRENTGNVIVYSDLNPLDDPDTQTLIARGDTLGVFYIESPAMRQLQKKTQRGDFEHIVIHSSIIRPAANTFINEYVRRLRGEPYEPLHPILDRVLHETYGIMVYQEDVCTIAVEMAGFSPEEGDGLRKTLSKKRNARKLSMYRVQFDRGARARGISSEVVAKVWSMILSFGGYSFCKPHSASYALVSFKSAYLRCHYPAEFMAAVISNQGGYYSAFAYISEARRMGLRVLSPDVNHSNRAYTGKGQDIRVGLMQLKGLKNSALDTVLEEREKDGSYRSFEEFMGRTRLDPSDVRIFVKSGCLDSIAGKRSRAELLWQMEVGHRKAAAASQATLSLFASETIRIPKLEHYDFRTALLHEVEILGFPLMVHPLDLYEDVLKNLFYVRGCDMNRHIGRTVTMIGWWVTNKMVYTKNEEPMAFISFEDRTAMYETVFFPGAFQKYASRFTPVRPYILHGKVEDDMGAIALHVEKMEFLGRGSVKRKKRNLPTGRTLLPCSK
jgi:DNA-directed DNA polymerase III PolC